MRDIATLLPVEAKRHGTDIFLLSRPFDAEEGELARLRLATVHGNADSQRLIEEFALFAQHAVNSHDRLRELLKSMLGIWEVAIRDQSADYFRPEVDAIRRELHEISAGREIPDRPTGPVQHTRTQHGEHEGPDRAA